jgi:DNA polymerase/3'-5' exonuclease PolX
MHTYRHTHTYIPQLHRVGSDRRQRNYVHTQTYIHTDIHTHTHTYRSYIAWVSIKGRGTMCTYWHTYIQTYILSHTHIPQLHRVGINRRQRNYVHTLTYIHTDIHTLSHTHTAATSRGYQSKAEELCASEKTRYSGRSHKSSCIWSQYVHIHACEHVHAYVHKRGLVTLAGAINRFAHVMCMCNALNLCIQTTLTHSC